MNDSALVARFTPLIRALARKTALRCGLLSDEDDLFAEGMMGLLKAAKTYKPDSRGASFATYVRHRASGAMLDAIRKWDWLGRRTRHNHACAGTEPPRLVGFAEPVQAPPPAPYVNAEQADSIRALTRGLSREQQFVILSSVVHGLSLGEIGKAVGISESRCSQVRTEALRTLRAENGVQSGRRIPPVSRPTNRRVSRPTDRTPCGY